MMDSEHFRKVLQNLRKTLLQAEETGGAAERTVELDQSRVGRLSRMDAMQAQAMSIETGRRRRQELRKIGAALRRIEQDEFGFCAACGEEIAVARLEIDPTAEFCIRCATEQEQ